MRYFYPRPPRGGRRCVNQPHFIHFSISIHALREEGDPTTPVTVRCMFLFLSTPSARRATAALVPICGMRRNFYPRPPRGGRRSKKYSASGTWQFLSTPSARRATKQGKITHGSKRISIHALREEGDPIASSNPPVWVISIHALREEGDCGVSELVRRAGNFYPRPPRGGRRSKAKYGRILCVISIHALREEGDPARTSMLWSWTNFYPRPPRGGRPS